MSSTGRRFAKPVRVRWWEAGGLHAHVTHPDGMWEHLIWKAGSYWEVDALVIDLEKTYGEENVEVTG